MTDSNPAAIRGVGAPSAEAPRSAHEPRTPRVQARRRRDWLVGLLWILIAAPLLPWGLPDRSADSLLFGGAAAWGGEQFRTAAALDARGARRGGADTDLDPIRDRTSVVDLTATDADRAQILRRFRLFTRQPDEMITFMALQRMKPRSGDLDPGLYQYGGAWIYGVGAALGLCHLTGVAQITSNADVYLEHPERFGRFYVIARSIALLSAALLLVGAMRIARRLSGEVAAWLTVLCIAVCPVFLTMSLEAKPHMPSACLVVWATLAALRILQSGARRDVFWLGAAAGAAAATVLTGVVAAALWPALWLTRQSVRATVPDRMKPDAAPRSDADFGGRFLIAGIVAACAYVITNPYVLWNALFDRAMLRGNLSNSTDMYSIGRIFEGAARVGELLLESAGIGILSVGVLGLAGLVFLRRREIVILCAPALAMTLIAIPLGAGKPAEFGRFLLIPTIALALGAGAALAECVRRQRIVGGLTVALALTLSAMRAWDYRTAFADDVQGERETRHRAARFLEASVARDAAIGLTQEPAPYATPPIDFAHRRVLLLPRALPAPRELARLPDWLVVTADDEQLIGTAWWRDYYAAVQNFGAANPARITWANKPVFVFRRVALLPPIAE